MPHTILSVDGDAAVRSTRNRILHDAGFEVIEAADGPGSLNLASDNQPALVVLAMEMPGMDGLAVCRRLKADPRTAFIPVLHIAGPGEPYRGYPESLESGADVWLQEPVDPPVLIAAAKALIRARSAGTSVRNAGGDAPSDDRLPGPIEAATRFPEQNPAPVLRVGDDGVLLYANPGSNVLMAEWRCEIGQAVPGDLRHAVEQALAQGAPAEFDVRGGGRDYSFVIAPVAGCRYANVYGRDLTQRQRLADQLREHIEELETVMDVAPVAIWVSHDPRCQEITGNRMAARFYEAGAEENVSANVTTVRRFFQGGRELEARDLPMQQAAARGVDIRDYELDVLLPSGRLMHMLGNASPLRDADGQVRGCVGTFLDITERKRAEEALRESEAFLRSFYDSPGMMRGFVELMDGRIVHVSCNTAAAEMYGVDRESIAGTSPREAGASEELVRTWEDLYEQCRRTGKPVSMEYARRDADGQERWLLATAGYLGIGHTGNPRFAYTILDLTDRKRADEALRESERRERARAAELQALMDATPAAIFIAADPECRHMTGNRMAYALVRSKPGSNVSKSPPEGEEAAHYRMMKDGVEIPPNELPMQRAASTGQPVRNYEIDLALDDGSCVNLLGNALPLLDENRRGRGAVGVFTDITEHKRAETRLRDSQKLESLGLLAGGVAHDFNNLLVGVIGNASLAQEMLPPGNPALELLEGVIRTGEQAAHLTRQMLAYSGKGKFLVEPVDLSALIPEMSGLVRPFISKKIALQLDLAEDLPPVEADRGQMQQVFMNLTLNAAEAIGSREGLIAVRTGVQDVDESFMRFHPEAAALRPGKYVCLEVRDNGCGMDDATRAKIFDPFFSTKFTGRGLGLAAVAGIVRGHKAAITVSSAPGKGSCFTVLFPAAAGAAGGPSAADRDMALQGSGVVLVVDDEPIVRDMAKIALERHGYTVLLADSGLAAVDIFKRYPGQIALVVLDLSMPQMSGEEALPEIRKIRPDVKALVSSGYSEAETMTLFKGQRVSGFIQKPYTSKGIAEKVKVCLG